VGQLEYPITHSPLNSTLLYQTPTFRILLSSHPPLYPSWRLTGSRGEYIRQPQADPIDPGISACHSDKHRFRSSLIDREPALTQANNEVVILVLSCLDIGHKMSISLQVDDVMLEGGALNVT
jgi:hypothetical protein